MPKEPPKMHKSSYILIFLKSVPPNSGNNNLFPDFVSGVTRRVILIYTEFGLPPKKLANIF